ncbi:MAG TPA: FAD-dependent oxidoreductase [Myxococcales bacterium]|jgi:thioredoxin reductase (NADPH)|nr:FAD-dependent oxidoreductase [Myxococcales bacterium]
MSDGRAEEMFPRLTPEQLERLAKVGRRRDAAAGEVLVEQGAMAREVFVVLAGTVVTVHRSGAGERLIVTLHAGQFTGELSLLWGRRHLAENRAATAAEVLAVSPDALRKIVSTDTDLGDVILNAYILRRSLLTAAGQGDAVLIGSQHSAGTLRLREFMSRNNQPCAYLDLDRDPDVQALLERLGLSAGDVPIVICRGERVLKNPSNEEVAERLGWARTLEPGAVRDVVIVGAGPAGLAAAVYGASEGLDTLALEGNAPGGQAGSSTRIENYLGFPTGISGQEFANRAYVQAQKFGAELAIPRSAVRLRCERRPYAVELSDGSLIRARAVVVATGVRYRRPESAGMEKFEGVGIYYAATPMEAQLCRDEKVLVVGGSNSAGQAAVFLAPRVRQVDILVRGAGLASTMSRYLVARIEESPNIALHSHQEIFAAEGDDHLERVQIRDGQTGETRTLSVRHAFIMTGGDPNTGWLRGSVALDERGFVKTGANLSADDLAAWPLQRTPHLLETSVPGVFAVGDVRAASMKRVASAVGEGSACIQLVHSALAE